MESLALKYRQVYESFKPYIKHKECLYIVGGGARNRLLNQFAANALNMPVMAGPSEATALGNILLQFETLGEIRGSEQRSAVIRASFDNEEFFPKDRSLWDDAYSRFLALYVQQ